MEVNPQVKALRGNRALQRRLQHGMDRAISDWRALPGVALIADELKQYGEGAELAQLPSLARLMASHARACSFVDQACEGPLQYLGANPLAQITFQHSYSEGFMSLRLMGAGGATLSLLCYEERPRSAQPDSACFTDCERHEIVIAGGASGTTHRREECGRIDSAAMQCKPGYCYSYPAQRMSRQIQAVSGQMVVLQLGRVPRSPGPTREFALADGALLHQSCGDKSVSQCEMALAVLGEMHCADAVPAMEQVAASGPAHLRWEAMRHVLTIDPIAGMQLLTSAAQTAGDELSGPAQDLYLSLARQYPQFAKERSESCPA